MSEYGPRRRHRVIVSVPTPHARQHRIFGRVEKAPPQLRRFKHAILDNPKKMPKERRRLGVLKGWVVRSYDPDEYARSGKTVEHERQFKLEERDKLKQFYQSEIKGKFRTSAESSNKPRDYLEEIRELPDGTPSRPTVDWETIL